MFWWVLMTWWMRMMMVMLKHFLTQTTMLGTNVWIFKMMTTLRENVEVKSPALAYLVIVRKMHYFAKAHTQGCNSIKHEYSEEQSQESWYHSWWLPWYKLIFFTVQTHIHVFWMRTCWRLTWLLSVTLDKLHSYPGASLTASQGGGGGWHTDRV